MKHYVVASITQQDSILYLSLRPKKRRDQLHFMAGQYASIGFYGANGRPTPMRSFSIVSSAVQSQEISFAIRVGGQFTAALAELTPGDKVFVRGAFGEFVVDERYDRNLVMIAGGIGITPIMSILRTAAESGVRIPTTVLYSCRKNRAIPFRAELIELERQNPWLRVITFVTDTTILPETPRLLSGRMTQEHIHEVVGGNFVGSTYFVCGPKGFMDSTQAMLAANNVPEDRIIAESFTQSSKLRFGNGYSIQKLTFGLTASVMLVGIGFITTLDLTRYVPRHTTQNVAQTVQTTGALSPNSDNSSSPSSPVSSQNTTTTPSAPSSNSAPQMQQTYQAPVTSVS